MRKVAIFNAGSIQRTNPSFHALVGGDYDRLFTEAASLLPADVLAVDLQVGDPLPDPDDLRAVIVTGSPAMVTDRHPWAESAASWLTANLDRVPILGVCFGHQLIAQALGGKLDWNQAGPEYGTIGVELSEECKRDPLMSELPPSLKAQCAHFQTVTETPRGAVVLARGASGIQALRFSTLAWGIQFHPEYSQRTMSALITTIRDKLSSAGVDVNRTLAAVEPTETARTVLNRFLTIAAAESTRRRHTS